jgi:hypothetical protein
MGRVKLLSCESAEELATDGSVEVLATVLATLLLRNGLSKENLFLFDGAILCGVGVGCESVSVPFHKLD